jgi:hypothetical protein
MLPLDRRKRGGPHLEWRVRLFAVAAVLGLAGIYFDYRRLTGAAILLLLGGLALRFVSAQVEDAAEDEPEDEPTGEREDQLGA